MRVDVHYLLRGNTAIGQSLLQGTGSTQSSRVRSGDVVGVR